jgi:hypothetical protein
MRFGVSGVRTVGAACVLSVAMHGCARQIDASDSRPEPGSSAVEARLEHTPSSLTDAGRFAENIYDYARANDWKNAAFEVMSLSDAIKEVRAEVEGQSDLKDDLYGHALATDRAVTEHDRSVAMREANEVTLDVIEMTTAYELRVPSELRKLDYYGRELQIWAEAQDITRLQATTLQLIREGNRLRRAIDAQSQVEGGRLATLLAQIEGAETFADYASLSKSVHDEVDRLDRLFQQ